jgi:hypothetical protein
VAGPIDASVTLEAFLVEYKYPLPSPLYSLFSSFHSSPLLSLSTHIDFRQALEHRFLQTTTNNQQPTSPTCRPQLNTPPAQLATLEGAIPIEDAVVVVVVVVVVVRGSHLGVFCAISASGGTPTVLALCDGFLHSVRKILIPGGLRDVLRRDSSDSCCCKRHNCKRHNCNFSNSSNSNTLPS